MPPPCLQWLFLLGQQVDHGGGGGWALKNLLPIVGIKIVCVVLIQNVGRQLAFPLFWNRPQDLPSTPLPTVCSRGLRHFANGGFLYVSPNNLCKTFGKKEGDVLGNATSLPHVCTPVTVHRTVRMIAHTITIFVQSTLLAHN